MSHRRIASSHGSPLSAAGTLMGVDCYTGGPTIVFLAAAPRMTIVASHFPGSAGPPTRPTTSGDSRRPVLARAVAREQATIRISDVFRQCVRTAASLLPPFLPEPLGGPSEAVPAMQAEDELGVQTFVIRHARCLKSSRQPKRPDPGKSRSPPVSSDQWHPPRLR